MKSNYYYSRMAALALAAAAVELGIAVWPAACVGQSSRRNRPDPAMRSVDPNDGQGDPWARYEIILRRNIFSRTRRPYVAPDPNQVEPSAPVRSPESYFVLKGIVQENDAFIAFVEDTRSGQVLRLRRNDSVARGTIVSLDLDTIEYRCEDKTTTVRMGHDLEGAQGASMVDDELMNWPLESAPASQPAQTGRQGAPVDNEDEIIKRLMEQRRQQLGQ